MYLPHYNLNIKPFQISTDPRFLWLGENHKEALAILKYGIMDNRGFLLLTGDVGTGKTTLINALINSLGEEVVAAFVPDPTLEKMDFFNYVSGAFGNDQTYDSKGEFIESFKTFLNTAYSENKKVLLIIDEAHRISYELLEEIRLLSNIERQNTKLINIFFVGQTEFNNLLWEKRNRALKQRITISHNISPLTSSETGGYIRHRLKVAGTEKQIFTDSAVNEIHYFSNGLPRMINIVCDHALLTGYVKGASRVSVKIVRECVKDLHIPRSPENGEGEGAWENREAFEKTYGKDQEGKKAGLFKQPTTYLAMVLLLFFAVSYLYYIDRLDDSIHKAVNIWHEWTSDILPSGGEKGGRPEHTADGPDTEAPPSEEPPSEPRETASQSGTARVIFDDDPEIKEVALSGDRTHKDDTSQDKPEQDKLSSVKPDVEFQAEGQPPAADTTEKFKKLYRVLTLLEQKVTINFPRNSNEMTPDVIGVLSDIAEVLIYYPGISIRVIGYTDASGVYSYNKSLSRFRANMVKGYLVGRGVQAEQITTIGMGPQNPIGENKTATGRKINRRVEIMLNEES